jgi:hypothetical protein
LKNRQQVKKVAAEINAIVPVTETLYAVDPDYQPLFFYVKAPLGYVSRIANLPTDTHFFLVRTELEKEAAGAQKWAPRSTHQLARIKDSRKREMVLFEVGPSRKGR